MCSASGFCSAGLACRPLFESTLGALTGLYAGTPDPDHAGEFLAGSLSDIPVTFSGNFCSQGCGGEAGGSCGTCTTCSYRFGPTRAWHEVVGIWDVVPGIALGSGLCRPGCVFDDTSRGGCTGGTTCDPGTNTCIDACTSDRQCRLELGLSQRRGLVAHETGSASCNVETGRCEWTPPSASEFRSPCSVDQDCRSGIGSCLQYCTWSQCDGRGMDGELLYPCPDGAECVRTAEESPGICIPRCAVADDCPSRTSCVGGYCQLTCSADSECRSEERCRPLTMSEGSCSPICDPAGTGVVGAVECSSQEQCVGVPSRDFGFCYRVDGLCIDDSYCVGGQSCEYDSADDSLGRCR